MKFTVPDMSCGHCTAAIEKAIKDAAPQAQVACDLGAHTVSVTGIDSPDTAKTAMQKAGYESELVAA